MRLPLFFVAAQRGIIIFRRLLRANSWSAPRCSFRDNAVFSRESFFFVRLAQR
jgi:hypothetical protein